MANASVPGIKCRNGTCHIDMFHRRRLSEHIKALPMSYPLCDCFGPMMDLTGGSVEKGFESVVIQVANGHKMKFNVGNVKSILQGELLPLPTPICRVPMAIAETEDPLIPLILHAGMVLRSEKSSQYGEQ